MLTLISMGDGFVNPYQYTSIQELTNLSNLCYTAMMTFLAFRTGFDKLYLILSAEFGTSEYENMQQ